VSRNSDLWDYVEKIEKGAESVRLLVMAGLILTQEEILRQYPLPPLSGGLKPDCGCPPFGTCNNSMCPRAPRITYIGPDY
jgi:hypothetical protein